MAIMLMILKYEVEEILGVIWFYHQDWWSWRSCNFRFSVTHWRKENLTFGVN